MTARSWNVFAIAGEAVRGVGWFSGRNRPCRTPTAPQIFVHGNFLKIIGRKKHGKTTKAPAYLDEIAVRQWKEKSRQLSGREDLTPADWSNLELYCVNYSIYRKAVEDLATRGFSIVNSQGSESRNPALSAKADAERIMIKMASLLGFDPVSRRRNPPETEEEDELDRLA